jgi:DNA-binding Xre family transcriptional regulator
MAFYTMIQPMRGIDMGVSYKKLFKLMIDRDLKKKDLRELAGIGNSTMTKLANDENVTMEVIAKICNALDCKMDDIVEIISNEK